MPDDGAETALPGVRVRDLGRVGEASGGRITVPTPDEAEAVGRDVRRREALTYLVGAGTVIRAVDRVQRRAVLFHKEALASARTRLSEAFPNARTPEAGFLAREAGATLGISRKFSIPLLEHLDATGFTRRAGDRRVIVGLELCAERVQKSSPGLSPAPGS